MEPLTENKLKGLKVAKEDQKIKGEILLSEEHLGLAYVEL